MGEYKGRSLTAKEVEDVQKDTFLYTYRFNGKLHGLVAHFFKVSKPHLHTPNFDEIPCSIFLEQTDLQFTNEKRFFFFFFEVNYGADQHVRYSNLKKKKCLYSLLISKQLVHSL